MQQLFLKARCDPQILEDGVQVCSVSGELAEEVLQLTYICNI